MAVQEELLGTADTAVVDPLSLYRIAVGHTPKAVALRDAVRTGRLRLVTPSVAFAVACAMRNCWDEECTQAHQGGTGVPLRKFQEGGGVEIVDLSPADTVSAGQLYAGCSDRRVVGPEVLAACHSSCSPHRGASRSFRRHVPPTATRPSLTWGRATA